MTVSDGVTLTIDGVSVTARRGTLLVEAAKQVGIDVPIFCYHPKLKPVGACRMCLVQIEKLPRLQTACTTPVGADMVVHTRTREVVDAQNGVLELLLANHPLDCPICDKGGECPLQDNAFRYGPGVSRFTEEKRQKAKAYPLSDLIVLDRERCIMCYRCVRFHQEITGDESLAAVSRGADTEIDVPPGSMYDSIFSGNTIELCPVGALTSRQYRFKARPWDLVRTPSVCTGCAVGCNVEIHSRAERVLRLVARENPSVDRGWLCDRGRFGTLPADDDTRLLEPRVALGSSPHASWQSAIERAAQVLQDGAGILASPDLSNEAYWLLGQMGMPAALWPPVSSGYPIEGSIVNLATCKRIVLVGLDAWFDLPIMALHIRAAVQAGAVLVVVGESNGLFRDTARWLKATPEQLWETAHAAVSELQGEGPAAVLAHPSMASTVGGKARLTQLAAALGADGDTGMVGAPLLGANGRGAQLFAPELAAGAAQGVRDSVALLLVGDQAWDQLEAPRARLVLATTTARSNPRAEVQLPLAHAYERQGSVTNLEGRVQLQDGGAAPRSMARPDWAILADLAGALGREVPRSLADIRDAMGREHPILASAFEHEALVLRV